MRKLIMTRGASGAGKSHFLRTEAGLAGHVLAADEIRLMMGAPVLNLLGQRVIDQSQPHKVVPMMRNLFRERIGRGETLAVDMVQESPSDMAFFIQEAHQARYEVMVVDFGDKPLEECLSGNVSRDPWRKVPVETVMRQHANVAASRVEPGPGLEVVRWAPDGSHADKVRAFLDVPVLDLSRFRSVVHVGDLQGCLTVLAGEDGPLAKGLDPDVAYVFVGDLLDRGIENDKVFAWFLENAVGRDNVFLLWGNHEDHIQRWAAGLPSVSTEFGMKTEPQLIKAGFKPSDAEPIMAMARDVLPYTWNGHKVLVTHAGLPTVPAQMGLVSQSQYSRGTGSYEDPVDQRFDEHAPEGWVQVHGHRNHGDLPVQASARSFNLEQKVEFGGHLRLATLGADGWTTAQYRNKVFAPAADRRQSAVPSKTAAPWVGRPDNGTTISAATVAALRAHPGVKETRAAAAFPHVSSFAFTKDVFYSKQWDEVVVKARGLFVDTGAISVGADGQECYPVVARGYDKFFNIGEREETTVDNWAKGAQFPVTAYLKENGFLGVLSVDPRSGDLFVSSKSKAEGPFAGYFNDILKRTFTVEHLDRIRRWLADNDACMTLEVIDPVNDPHIVEYDREGLVVLDVFRRAEESERLPYDKLKLVGDRLGLNVKQHAAVLRTEKALKGFLAAMSAPGATYKGAMVEGFVLEDASGSMVKLKCEDYAFWKRMRGAKERILGYREGRMNFDRARYSDERSNEVVEFLLRLPDADLKKDIVALRKAFAEACEAADEAEREVEAAPAP